MRDMARPDKKVHIPLDFREALSDLLKVKPDDEPQEQDNENSKEAAQEEE